MFGVTYKYKIDPVKTDRITLHMTPRTYIDAFKPLILVYGVIGLVWVGVNAFDRVREEHALIENDLEDD